jgi:large subunit ribosomal protein L4
MATAKVYTNAGDTSSQVTLPAALFDTPVHEHALYEAVKCYNANQRQGTSSVKSRSTMSGGGKKPWRQKGTGRARSGSNTSPLWVGGGRAFGPRPRDYSYTIPKKVRRLALTSALSARAKEGEVYVIESVSMDRPRTKDMATLLAKMGLNGRKTLFVMDAYDANIFRSVRNIPKVRACLAHTVNAHDLLAADSLVLTQKGLSRLTEVFAG